jgi:SAM-dependent methyltransferase
MQQTPTAVAAKVRPFARRVRRRLRRRWTRLRTPAGASPRPAPKQFRAGVVERFVPPWVEGWVAMPKGAPPVPVRLQVNNVDVVSTQLADPAPKRRVPGAEARRFRFAVNALWDYTSRSDRVRVVVGDDALPIVGHGTFYRPIADGEHSLADLLAKFAEGYVFSRTGGLQLSKDLDTEWQRVNLAQAARISDFMCERFGIEAFFIYGTLLGAVREGGPIGHDSDLDLGFVSHHQDPLAAAGELRDIAFALIEAGFRVRAHRHHLRIANDIDSHQDVHVDLFHTFFDADDVLRFPYGVAGVGDIHRSDWGPLREMPFAGGSGLVPSCAEKVAAVLYGAGWREPQPGFAWDRDRKASAKEAWMSAADVRDIYWADFYAHSEPMGASTFFGYVDEHEATPRAVLDLGCGDGRDSFAFARSGRVVVGVDRSAVAIDRARAAADGAPIEFRQADIADADAIGATIDELRDAGGGGPVLYYLRFLLHAIVPEAQTALLETLASKAQPGDVLAAEFRTDADKSAKKVHGHHYRRFQNGPEFSASLTDRFGFEVLEQREATGLSPYRDEDPHLYWVIARRPAG